MLEENRVLKKRLIEGFRRVEGTEIAVEVEEFPHLTVFNVYDSVDGAAIASLNRVGIEEFFENLREKPRAKSKHLHEALVQLGFCFSETAPIAYSHPTLKLSFTNFVTAKVFWESIEEYFAAMGRQKLVSEQAAVLSPVFELFKAHFSEIKGVVK